MAEGEGLFATSYWLLGSRVRGTPSVALRQLPLRGGAN